jgi:arylsulfatase A-like enzyme
VTLQEVARTEWRFDAAPPLFEAGPGVADLALRDGRLVGRTTAAEPVLRIESPGAAPPADFVHAVEVRMRVSAGQNVRIELRGAEHADFAALAGKPQVFWSVSSPLVPGEELRTYSLRGTSPVPSGEVRHAFLAPTDAADATFEIESIRVVYEKEYLAGIPSGVGWHGLAEIHRETLVARAPEAIRFPVTIPARGWLDLAVGTVGDAPVTFRVSARRGEQESLLLERTVTTPRRWERAPVELAELAGEPLELTLSLASPTPAAIGFWGAPVVRARSSIGRRDLQGVVLIQADTLRPDHLDVYGYERETAPSLRRMAAEGALFRRCIAQGTWTKVSSPSILLSLYPSSHRIANFTDRLPDAATSLAEVFRDAGFATLSLSSVFFTGKLTNLQQGYEELHESTSLADPESSKTAREYVDRLLPWLELHRQDPFLVYLHVFDPHDPYRPPRPYDTLFGDPSDHAEHERQAQEVRRFIENPLLRAFGMPSRAELAAAGFDPDAYVAHDRDWYDGSIRAMDVELGRVFEALRQLGLAESTLVVFTSDHGEEFLEHGRTFHGQSVHGELARVPLVLWAPGRVPAARVVEETVQSVDIAPTILGLAGLPPLPQAQGASLAPLLAERAPGADPPPGWPRPAIIEKLAESDPTSPTRIGGVATAIVDDGWKLIERVEPERPTRRELYDVERDPLEQEDLAAERPDVVTGLVQRLEAWRAAVSAVRLEPEAAAEGATSPEELERLKALGYVQ